MYSVFCILYYVLHTHTVLCIMYYTHTYIHTHTHTHTQEEEFIFRRPCWKGQPDPREHLNCGAPPADPPVLFLDSGSIGSIKQGQVCVCVYTHTSIPAFIPTYIHTGMHTCIQACIHAYIHACMHACMHTCTRTYMHT